MSDPVTYPELIIGTAGAIGVNMDALALAIDEILMSVGSYRSHHIKLTAEMIRLQADIDVEPAKPGKAGQYNWKMDFANAIRKKYGRPDTLARLAIDRIRQIRLEENSSIEASSDEKRSSSPLTKTAFVIRQIKHPEEVSLFRQVYGKQFILISAYADEAKRKKKLIEDIKLSAPTQTFASTIEFEAIKLIERDSSEIGEKLGQQLRDAFHLADCFVDGFDVDKMKNGLTRFVQAFFGKTDITPRKDEYGMYAAKSASLRSSDLSRQIGAAVFSQNGELITQGCNEVPKVGGGTYWDGEDPDFRDIKKGFDPNEKQKREILRDVVERLRVAKFLTTDLLELGSDAAIVDRLTEKGTLAKDDGVLRDSWLMDLTEFGRVVHAEMCAICDAARLGKSLENSVLFCTTFPCHNCTKHIIASGIRQVVYMEPYPKSRAKELHEDEIEIETNTSDKMVSFIPFTGISPQRYRDIFQKGRRKLSSGGVSNWALGEPRPMIDIGFPAYTTTSEIWAIGPLAGEWVT